MADRTPEFLPAITGHRLPGLTLDREMIHPRYDGYSIANISGSLCSWIGAAPWGTKHLNPAYLQAIGGPFRHVIFLVVDGLGLDFFERYAAKTTGETGFPSARPELLKSASVFPLTSVVPSTTSAALTTLWTGKTPAEHGVVGYEVWLKEYGMIANMILQTPASFNGDAGGMRRTTFSPERFLPVPTLGSHLADSGIAAYAFQHSSIVHSGLSTMLLPGVDIIPYRTVTDLLVSLEDVLERRSDEPTYAYVYWGDLDELQHRFGPSDKRIELEWLNFSRLLDQFMAHRARLSRNRTLLVVSADHGQINTPPAERFDLRRHPEFMHGLTMAPSGEGRLAYLYIRRGHEAAVEAYIQKTWPDEFILLPSEKVIEAGLLGDGAPYAALADRVGDSVLISRNGNYLWWAMKDNLLAGRHGGLSRQEMLVPLISLVI